jgi:hypothetical protein
LGDIVLFHCNQRSFTPDIVRMGWIKVTSPAIIAKVPVTPYNPVAWENDRDGIIGAG